MLLSKDNHIPFCFFIIENISLVQRSLQKTVKIKATPCPGTFSYEEAEADDDRWYGDISLKINSTVEGATLRITLDRPSQLLVSWAGAVISNDNKVFIAYHDDAKLFAGTTYKLRIMAKFDTSKAMPMLKTIHFNSRQICPVERVVDVSTGDTASKPDLDVYEPSDVISDNDKRTTTSRTTSRPSRSVNCTCEEEEAGEEAEEEQEEQPEEDASAKTTITLKNFLPKSLGPNGSGSSSNTNKNPNGNSNNNFGGGSSGNNNFNPEGSNSNFDSGNQGGSRPNNGGSGTNNNFNQGSSNSNGFDNEGSNSNNFNSGGGSSNNFNHGTPNPNNFNSGSSTNNFEVPNGNFNQGGGSGGSGSGHVPCGTVSVVNPLITNGQKTHHGQWPWHIALYKTEGINLNYLCGGSLISKNKVITAAHCLVSSPGNKIISYKSLVVYLGKYNLRQYTGETGVQTKEVSRLNVNPTYNSSNFHGDVAILTLSSDAEFSNYVRPVCTWEAANSISDIEGKEGVVAGWGLTERDQTSEELKMATLPVVSTATCLRSYPKFYAEYLSETAFCAGFRNGTSPCNGDSGGGLVFKKNNNTWYLRGIVSLSVAKEGLNFCNPDYYVIFTDTARYVDFIRKNL